MVNPVVVWFVVLYIAASIGIDLLGIRRLPVGNMLPAVLIREAPGSAWIRGSRRPSHARSR